MTAEVSERKVFRGSFIVPLAIAVALMGLFLFALYSGDPSRLPSALIGKPVPEFNLAPVEGLAESGKQTPGFSNADLATGEVSVVNVWASWCGPCIQEQPLLVRLKNERGLRLMGINYKDGPSAARRFLTRLGNPFDAIGADVTGRVAIDWGVYGVPETYVVDGAGQIVYKIVGPLTNENVKKELLPAISEAKKAGRNTANAERS